MYTQCPDCNKAFRVTADILRQASGKVRCGGCGVAFNALDRLTEELPSLVAEEGSVLPVPETLPRQANVAVSSTAASAEQSAALVELLDELAVPDVKIEDTGVEWRVLSEFDTDFDNDAESSASEDANSETTGSLKFIIDAEESESSEDPETADDQTDEVMQVRDASLFDEWVADAADDDARSAPDGDDEGAADRADEELRFDDDTILPDDFHVSASAENGEVASEIAENDSESAAPAEHTRADLALSDADDWQDILGEVEFDESSGVPADGHDAHGIAAGEGGRSEFGAPGDVPADSDELTNDSTGTPTDAILDAVPPAAENPHAADELPPSRASEDPGAASQFSIEDVEPGAASDSVADADRDIVLIASAESEYADRDEDTAVDDIIDQDLMRFLNEEPSAAADAASNSGAASFDAEAEPAIETIIMEGEFVRTALEQEALDAARDLGASEEQSFVAMAKRTFAGQLAELEERPARLRRFLIASLILLSALLGVQFVHQNRESLARAPTFSRTFGSIYELLGQPVVPTWNVGGWRFEVTNGSTNPSEDVLTIQSRVGNRSSESLPYPLIHVALTDRYEDVIGNRILEPAEYLPAEANTTLRVLPGATFNATITIAEPSTDATGFKLNVCYRLAAGELRCAVETFR